jgi:hypothetical protein
VATTIQHGDVGTTLQVTIKDGDTYVDISNFTTKEILLRNPAGTVLTKTATVVTAVSGIIKYIVESGVFDTVGLWQIQGRVAAANSNFYSNIVEFPVERNVQPI